MRNPQISWLTPRQFLMDVLNALHSHKTLIENFKTMTFNDLNRSTDEININLEIEAATIKADINDVLNKYRDHAYWQAFQNEIITINENTTLGETVAYLEQMMVSGDNTIWIDHITNGRVFKVYNHLYGLSLHSDILSNQIHYEYYSKALSKLIECTSSDISQDIHTRHLYKYIHRIKPLKPIEDQNHPHVYLCPVCHQRLSSTNQPFCQSCGQKLYTYQSRRG